MRLSVRKIILMVYILVSCLFLSSCETQKNNVKKSDNHSVIFQFSCTYTEQYCIDIVHSEAYNRGCKYLFDAGTGKAVPFCFDVACEHKPSAYSSGGKLLEKGCTAYDYGSITQFSCGDTMFFLQERTLYSADLQGRNRKVICELSKPYFVNQNVCWFTEEALYIAYTNPFEWISSENGDSVEWLCGQEREKQEAGLLRIPYSGEGEEVLYSSDEFYEMQIGEIWYRDGTVYFQVLGKERPGRLIDYSQDKEVWQAMIDEEERVTFTQVFSYSSSSGELREMFQTKSYTGCYFFKNVYGLRTETGTLQLYRYTGEKTAETELPVSAGILSDHGIIAWDRNTKEAVMIDEESGKVIKRSPLTYDDITISVVVGESYYGVISRDGTIVHAYISEKDFWKGIKKGIVEY